MIFFLHGPDTYRSRQKIKELKEKFLKEVDQSSLNLTFLDGAKADIEKFNSAIATPPFLARKRMVVIDNLISENKDKNITQQILELLDKENLIKDVLLVFIESGDFNRNNILFKRLVKEKYAQEFTWLKDNELRNWIRTEFKKRGGNIELEAINKLIELVGNDLWEMNTEIDKLIAYSEKRAITVADVINLVKGKFDDNIFNFIDAIANKNKTLAHQLLADQLNSGANELYILAMLIRQFRILLLVKDLTTEQNYLTKQQVASKLAIHPFVAQKALQQIKNFSTLKLKNIYRQLLDTDIKIKTNQAEPKVLFDLLLTKIMN